MPRVERALGGENVPAGFSATATVTRNAELYRADVQVQSRIGSGQRTLENADCELLADSVALVIALGASKPGSKLEESNTELVPTLSAHASALWGTLPSLAVGVGGVLALEGFWRFRVELSGTYYAKQSATFEQTSAGANFQLVRVGARACRLFRVAGHDVAPCLGVELQRIDAQGFGGMLYSSGESYLWGPALGLLGRLRLFPALAVHVGAAGVVPIARQRFVYTDVGPLHRPAALVFEVFAGPEVLF